MQLLGIDPIAVFRGNFIGRAESHCPPECLAFFRSGGQIQFVGAVSKEQLFQMLLHFAAETVSTVRRYNKEFHNSIENRARESLGFKKKGETWVSETILFKIVKSLYPTSKVIKHHRPKWLQGLELDIYLPEHNLAFEYQGIQHFVAVEHWGGLAQLKKQQEHDARKKEICVQRGITLICINYDDTLTTDFVKAQIALSK